MERSYDFSKLHIGMELKSFAELCRIVGGNPKAKGNSRASMTKEFERYIVWEKARPGSNAIVITEIYEKPLPKKMRADNKYDMDILTCLRWGDQIHKAGGDAKEPPNQELSYTMRDLMVLCGFTSVRWNQVASKAREELRNALRCGISVSSEAQMFKFLNDLNYHVNNYCGNVLSRSLDRLVRDGYLESVRRWYLVEDCEGYRDATDYEQAECERLYSETKEALGIKRPNFYTSPKLYGELSKAIWNSLGLRRAFQTRRIVLNPACDPVTREEYSEAVSRINALSVEEFKKCIESDRDREVAAAQEKLDSIEDPHTKEIIDLFELTAHDVEGTTPVDLDMADFNRDALISWFIDINGADAYLSKKKEVDAWWKEHFESTRTRKNGGTGEEGDSMDSLLEEGFRSDPDLDALFEILFGEES